MTVTTALTEGAWYKIRYKRPEQTRDRKLIGEYKGLSLRSHNAVHVFQVRNDEHLLPDTWVITTEFLPEGHGLTPCFHAYWDSNARTRRKRRR
jgi:predicted ATP-grasp superfamily ATP-dependent carboligase